MQPLPEVGTSKRKILGETVRKHDKNHEKIKF